jgi:hypothetical protein
LGPPAFDRPSIINVNLAIAKAARVLNVQAVLTVEQKGFSGYRSAIASVGTRRRRGVEINA